MLTIGKGSVARLPNQEARIRHGAVPRAWETANQAATLTDIAMFPPRLDQLSVSSTAVNAASIRSGSSASIPTRQSRTVVSRSAMSALTAAPP